MQNLAHVNTYVSDPEDTEKTEAAADELSFWSRAVANWDPYPSQSIYPQFDWPSRTYLDRQNLSFSSANIDRALDVAPQIFRVPHFSSLQRPDPRSNSVLQEWEGYVTKIRDSDFTARLVDLTDPTDELEEADFPVDELSRDDKKLLREGAIFRWLIGYQDTIAGTRTRFSKIVFRRLPAWSSKDIDEARKKAAGLPGPERIDQQKQSNK